MLIHTKTENKIQRVDHLLIRFLLKIKICYGCETWSLIFRVEHRLRGFENSVKDNKVKGEVVPVLN